MPVINLIKEKTYIARFVLNILRVPSQHKYLLRWIRSRQKDYLIKNKQPWIVFEAIDFLNSCQLERKNVFEYGSGGSTLFWLEKGANCISIEHDAVWYAQIKSLTQNYTGLDYRLVEAEPINELTHNIVDPDYSNPDQYISAEYEVNKVYYKNYVSQIDEFDNNYFDIILIDGRARPSCIKHSVDKVKPGGLLLLDNVDRAYYTKKTTTFLKNFERRNFFGIGPQSEAFGVTAVYLKKKKEE